MMPGLNLVGAARPLEYVTITADGTNTGSPPSGWVDGVTTGSTVGTFATNYGKTFASARYVTRLRIYGSTSRGMCTNTASATAILEWSDDNSSWSAAGDSGSVADAHVANWVGTVTSTELNPHRYWRWRVTNTAGDSNMHLAESEWVGY